MDKPVLPPLTGVSWWLSAASIGVAAVLAVASAARVAAHVDLLQWWVPVALVTGMGAADFSSGIVHWAADTWGRDDLPVLGPRLLVPFRVHHVNPDDFVSRPFVDTNGEVAMVAALALAGSFAIPLDTPWGAFAGVFSLAFCGLGAMTNQIHQWAHRPMVPPAARIAQHARLILGREAHALHHARPYHVRYCITTGWCNAALDRLAVFRRAERVITGVTGVSPRRDDRRYEQRHAGTARRGDARA